jgi:hypothetical protein
MRFLVPGDDAERARRVDVLSRAVDDPEARAEIDSGKLAESYWYTDSPLTTPGARWWVRFPTEPGVARPPEPGVLCPDGRLDQGMRLRELVGPGFVVLTNWCPWRPADDRERELTGRPVRLDQEEDDHLAKALRLPPRSVAVIRPDGHLAAVLHEPEGGPVAPLVSAALSRATGWDAGPPAT